jgi:hypothetical protein
VVNPHGGRGKASVCVPPCVHCMGSAGAAGPVDDAAQITAAPHAAQRRELCDAIIVVLVSSWRQMLGLLVQYCEHLGERLRGGAAPRLTRHSSVSNVRQVEHFLKQSKPLCARLTPCNLCCCLQGHPVLCCSWPRDTVNLRARGSEARERSVPSAVWVWGICACESELDETTQTEF